MSRIKFAFAKPGHKALIPYITVGFPDIEATVAAVTALADNGADIVELGIPFSDPLADGVTIQESSYQALRHGVTPDTCLELAGRIRKRTQIPLVFMTYYNPVLSFGLERFCKSCASSGIDGLIIPDLPPEEGQELETSARENGIDDIYLLAPTSNEKRIRLVAEKSRGFIYVVSVAGVTGVRNAVPANLKSFIDQVRRVARLPLCVGFGISTPEQAAQISHLADGIIIGSKIIQLMQADPSLNTLKTFARDVRRAMDNHVV